jgi:hypothetical protein
LLLLLLLRLLLVLEEGNVVVVEVGCVSPYWWRLSSVPELELPVTILPDELLLLLLVRFILELIVALLLFWLSPLLLSLLWDRTSVEEEDMAGVGEDAETDTETETEDGSMDAA